MLRNGFLMSELKLEPFPDSWRALDKLVSLIALMRVLSDNFGLLSWSLVKEWFYEI